VGQVQVVAATGPSVTLARDVLHPPLARAAQGQARHHGDDTIKSIGAISGDGGLIAMDGEGRAAFSMNDLGMYRGAVSSAHPVAKTAIVSDEPSPQWRREGQGP